MSRDFPVSNQVTLRGSVGVIQLSSVDIRVPSFFIQAMASNTGYILIGNTSTVNSTTALVALDSGMGAEFIASEFKINNPVFNLRDYFMVSTASTDKATLVWFS